MNKKSGFMDVLAHAIVEYRVGIGALFLALMLFSVFSVRWIKVENDITVYLPEKAEARQGLAIIPSAQRR